MSPAKNELYDIFSRLFGKPPESYAFVKGSAEYPDITGMVSFYPLWGGTIVAVQISGLSKNESDPCYPSIHGFHIHEGSSCRQGSNPKDAFPQTGGHYNPKNCLHPEHAGDMPPLLENDGFAFQIFYTDKFLPEEVVGRTVIIHSNADDFTTQPSGNSGIKIACGEIVSTLESDGTPAGHT